MDQLKSQMEPTVGRGLMDKLYHQDFKQHIKGIEILLTVSLSQLNFSFPLLRSYDFENIKTTSLKLYG